MLARAIFMRFAIAVALVLGLWAQGTVPASPWDAPGGDPFWVLGGICGPGHASDVPGGPGAGSAASSWRLLPAMADGVCAAWQAGGRPDWAGPGAAAGNRQSGAAFRAGAAGLCIAGAAGAGVISGFDVLHKFPVKD